METQNLDGETNLKPRDVAEGLEELATAQDSPSTNLHCRVEVGAPSVQLEAFHGTLALPTGQLVTLTRDNLLLRGCVLKHSAQVVALVLYTGHHTKAAMNNMGGRFKRSKMEGRINRDLLWCWVILLLLSLVGATGCGLWLASFSSPAPFLATLRITDINPIAEGFLTFWTFIIIMQIIIPISLYITIEMAKLGQVYFIHCDSLMQEGGQGASCKSFAITEDLGQVEQVLCDKTGTLTENSMVFRCCTVSGRSFEHAAVAKREVPDPGLALALATHTAFSRQAQEFLLLLAVCNTVEVVAGDGEEGRRYEAESADELALVRAAAAYGVHLEGRSFHLEAK